VGPATPRAEEMIDLLLSRGADLETRNRRGFTPRARQAELEDDSVAEMLKARGAR